MNQAGSSPPPSGGPPNAWISQPIVVITAPISTTNITGLRIWYARVELAKLADERRPQDRRRAGADSVLRVIGGLLVEREVELEHVHAGLAEERRATRPSVLSSISS